MGRARRRSIGHFAASALDNVFAPGGLPDRAFQITRNSFPIRNQH